MTDRAIESGVYMRALTKAEGVALLATMLSIRCRGEGFPLLRWRTPYVRVGHLLATPQAPLATTILGII